MKWLETEALQHFLSRRREIFRVLADYDNKYRVEIVRGPRDVFIVHDGVRHAVLRFTLACTIVSTTKKHTVQHHTYGDALVSKVEGEVLGQELTIIQDRGGVSQVFKGAELERVEVSRVELPRMEGSAKPKDP